uniref:Photosynthetic NDH subcomplex L 3 n=1 Tax=Kalanchoe fedtschenkoi TaxID=63787 RepID=A0A7N0TZV5_KALFE
MVVVVCKHLHTSDPYLQNPHTFFFINFFMAATLARFNGVSQTVAPAAKLAGGPVGQNRRANLKVVVGCAAKKNDETAEVSMQATRRTSLGFASAALATSSGIGASLADDNGFWITTPIPVPTIENTELANKETGTRSFLKIGIYIADIAPFLRAYRIKKYAFDLLALGDLIGKDAWNYVNKYLRLKSTFMYYDFDKVISAASPVDKKPLLDLANRLFDSVEKLEVSVQQHDLPQTESDYRNTSVILEEVMQRMA